MVAASLTPSDVPFDQPMLSSDEGVIVSHEDHYKNRIYKPESVVFDDMTNHWAKDEVVFLTEENVINGVGDNLFAPDAKLTKEQATLLTLRALKLTYTPEKEADWLNIAINNGLIENGRIININIPPKPKGIRFTHQGSYPFKTEYPIFCALQFVWYMGTYLFLHL